MATGRVSLATTTGTIPPDETWLQHGGAGGLHECLGQDSPFSPKDLRSIVGHSSGGTSYVIDRLETVGQIYRTDAVDGPQN